MRQRFRAGRAPSAKHGNIVRTIRLLAVLLYMFVDTGVAIYNRHFRPSNRLLVENWIENRMELGWVKLY